MVDDADRPQPRATAIDTGERKEILRELLDIERARLAVAVRIEEERQIVFPETTVIIRDIEHLLDALADKETLDAVATVPLPKLPKGRTWRPVVQDKSGWQNQEHGNQANQETQKDAPPKPAP